MSKPSFQQVDIVDSSNHDPVVMYDQVAFPKDRAIDTAEGVSESIVIDNGRFGDRINSALDIVSFASLFIFARTHNLERVSAWRPKNETTAAAERVSATFFPAATLLQAYASFTIDIAAAPSEPAFAILRSPPSADAAVSLTFDAVNGGVRLTLASKRPVICRLTACDFLQKISLVVTALAESPNVPCSELSLVTDAARALMPDLSRAIAVKHFEPAPHFFLRMADEYADLAAVSGNDEGYSYRELARLVRHIATQLTTVGVRPGDIVAVSGFMSLGTVAAMIAAMAAGGVMVTVDHALPKDRQTLILDISQPRFVINVRPHGEYAYGSKNDIDVSDWPSHAEIAALPENAFTPPSLSQDAAAYIFFTSGSSGVPKGVQGAHLGLAHFLDWQRSSFPIGPGDRAAQITALSFDAVLRDVLFPLTSGACLHFIERRHVLDARRFLRWFSEQQITVMHCVPSLMKAWLQGADGQRPFASLKKIFFAGEPLTEDLLNNFTRAASRDTTIVNLYGATETTLTKLWFRATRVEPGIQPVGTPQPGVDVAIFRDRRSVCGLWEIGEIAIRTPYRSKGYLGREDLTRQVFFPNPFVDDASDLIYFTGDLGRLRPDGMIEIFGRIDSQIKIRGVRIEPNEIESQILRFPGIRDAAVAVPKTESGEKVLTALVVSDRPVPPDQQIAFCQSIREELKKKLIDAMVPSSIIVLDSLPYLPNGKLDRQALLRTCQAQLDAETAAPAAAPETTEGRVLDAFRTLLRSPAATLDSSFEGLGGDSLSYVTAYLALEDLLGEVPPQWTSLSVRELGGLTRQPNGGFFTKVESSMLLRAVSISGVVAAHYKMINFPGMTSALMFVSGLMFGNIQAKEIAKSGTMSPIVRFARRLLTQYFALLAPYITKTFLLGAPAWAAVFLASDIVDWRSGAAHNSEVYWYVHCILHILIAFTAIYAVLRGFRLTKNAVTWTLLICCGIGLLGRDVAPYFIDPNFHAANGEKYNPFYYAPTSHIATFAFAALSTMVTGVRKLALAGVFVCYALAGLPGYGPAATAFLAAGGLWIMVAPKTPVPRLIAPILYNVAGASLFIYLLHEQLGNLTDRLRAVPVVLEWAGAIVVSVAAWRLWNLAAQVLPQRLARLGEWRGFRGLNLRMASQEAGAAKR